MIRELIKVGTRYVKKLEAQLQLEDLVEQGNNLNNHNDNTNKEKKDECYQDSHEQSRLWKN